MEKELFIDVLKHYHKSSQSEALNVISLKENFPYSQVLHALSARVSKDHHLSGDQSSLQMAAVYAADRAVLKDVMTRDNLIAAPWKGNGFHLSERMNDAIIERSEYVDSIQDQKSVNVPGNQSITDSSETLTDTSSEVLATVPNQTGPVLSSESKLPVEEDSVADQVMNDLEKLTQSKHNFESLFKDFENTFNRSAEPVTVDPDPEPYSEKQVAPLSGPEFYHHDMVLPENLSTVEETEGIKPPLPVSAEEPRMRALTRRKLQPPTIIDEIESSKLEIEPENPKQKEQLEMIDQFIKTQPSLTGANRQLNDEDLSTIRAGEFNDNVVSETLVEILLKQGKKDKAIEVLKKLIWKFPQKKAYFAAQIEELKK